MPGGSTMSASSSWSAHFSTSDSGYLLVGAPSHSYRWNSAVGRVPGSKRIASEGMWVFDARFYRSLKTLAEECFVAVIDTTTEATKRAPQESIRWGKTAPPDAIPDEDACEILFITPDAPYPVARAAYRALAKLYHSDVGGDDDRMRALNDAWTTVSQRYDMGS